MTVCQIEEWFKRVSTEKEKVLPFMLKEIDWDLFEQDLTYCINGI